MIHCLNPNMKIMRFDYLEVWGASRKLEIFFEIFADKMPRFILRPIKETALYPRHLFLRRRRSNSFGDIEAQLILRQGYDTSTNATRTIIYFQQRLAINLFSTEK